MLLLTLCLLLLCTCGSPKEPAGLALPAAEALQQGYAGLIFSSQAAPAYLLSASDLPRLLTLLAQAEPAALPQARSRRWSCSLASFLLPSISQAPIAPSFFWTR